MCGRTKIGNYELLRYKALNKDGVDTLYEGKVCKGCVKTIEEVGLFVDNDNDTKEEIKTKED